MPDGIHNPNQFHGLTTDDRIARAKILVDTITGHLAITLRLHESNKLLIYSDQISGQVPCSYAAHTLLLLQTTQHQIEVARLCSIWDKADLNRNSIRTLGELVRNKDVVRNLARERTDYHLTRGYQHVNPPHDPDKLASVKSMLDEHHARRAHSRGHQVARDLVRAFARVAKIVGSEQFRSIVNERDKNIAHSLSQSHLETKMGPIERMKMGDEAWLIEESMEILQLLSTSITGVSYSWPTARYNAKRTAAAFWNGCDIEVKE